MKERLSVGAELYGKIVSGEGTFEDFFSFYGLLIATRTNDGNDAVNMFKYYKKEWNEFSKKGAG